VLVGLLVVWSCLTLLTLMGLLGFSWNSLEPRV
jgi:hypothetical protein